MMPWRRGNGSSSPRDGGAQEDPSAAGLAHSGRRRRRPDRRRDRRPVRRCPCVPSASFRRFDRPPGSASSCSTPVTSPSLSQFGDRLSETPPARAGGDLGVELRMGVRGSPRPTPSRGRRSKGPCVNRNEYRGAHGDRGGGRTGLTAGPPARRRLRGRLRLRRPHRGPAQLHAPGPSGEVLAIGDMTSLNHLPGVAEVAMQKGLARRQDHPPAGGRKAD